MQIKLVDDNISKNDINTVIKFLKTNPKLSQGDKVKEFEEKFAQWNQSKYAVFVNSGSSANLAMIYAISLYKKLRNKRVVVPAISWSTTVAPLIQLGFEPIICDVDETLCLDTNEFKNIISKYEPSVLMLVHPLGYSADMSKITELCINNDIELLEDTCESLGSDFDLQSLGTFGIMSSFSTFISHHITSIEGGMVCTDNEDLYNILLMIRSHGWDRNLNSDKQQELRKKFNIDDFKALYTFYYPAFNIRNTEINAVIGLEQLNRLNEFINKREHNFYRYEENLNDVLSYLIKNTRSYVMSNFAYPIVSKYKQNIVKNLIKNDIECRPIICGNIAKQPFIKPYLKYNIETPMANLIDEYGLYLPNHPNLTNKQIDFVCEKIKESLK